MITLLHGDAKGEAYETKSVEKEVDVYECVECCPVGILNLQSGTLRSGTGAIKKKSAKGSQGNCYGKESRPEGTEIPSFGDEGGASRFYNNLPWSEDDIVPFFYAKRVAPKERNAGLTPADGGERANKHPCVKPISLVSWLCSLLCPPGGVILDCFAGSGTTGAAAAKLGFDAVLIEREDEYIPVIEGRVRYHGGDISTSLTPDTASIILPERTPMYVSKIQSNLKSGANYSLGPRTLIVGPNGSGKSAIVGAIELALAGFVSDITGRERVKAGIELLTLAPSDDDLWSQAEITDNRGGDSLVSRASTSIERNRSTGGAKTAVHVAPVIPVKFPIADIKEALSGKPETARNWLLLQVGGGITEKTILSAFLNDKSRGLYTSFTAGFAGTPVNKLLAAKDTVATKARSLGAEATGAEKMARNADADLPVAPTDEEIAELKREQAEAQKELWQFQQASSNDVARLEGIKNSAYGRWEAAYVEYEKAEAAYNIAASDMPPIPEGLSLADVSLKAIDACFDGGLADCPVCSSPLTQEGVEGQWRVHTNLVASAADARQKAAAASAAHQRLGNATRNLQSAQSAYDKAELDYQNAKAKPVATGDGIELAAILGEISEDLTKAQKAQAQWTLVKQLRQKAVVLREEAEDYKALSTAVKDVIAVLVEKLRRDFVDRVQSFLPERDVFDLQLFDEDRAVSRFGFVRNGSLHTALSGAEWARLTLALAASVSKEDELNVIIPEDRAFDARTLTEVLYALSASPEQIILCSPVEPEAVPESWTVIRVGGAGVAAAASSGAIWAEEMNAFPDVPGAFCSVCNGPIKNTPSGTLCPTEGHGGADLVDANGGVFLGPVPEVKTKRTRKRRVSSDSESTF